MLGPGEPVERRHAETDDLGIIGKRIDDAQPLLDVVERRDLLHALSEILLSRGRPQHQFVDALGKEMIERVDVAHSSTRLPPTPPGPDLTRQQWTPGVTSLSAGRGDDRLLVEVLPFARLVEDRGRVDELERALVQGRLDGSAHGDE